jgi:hypothetical protein
MTKCTYPLQSLPPGITGHLDVIASRSEGALLQAAPTLALIIVACWWLWARIENFAVTNVAVESFEGILNSDSALASNELRAEFRDLKDHTEDSGFIVFILGFAACGTVVLEAIEALLGGLNDLRTYKLSLEIDPNQLGAGENGGRIAIESTAS